MKLCLFSTSLALSLLLFLNSSNMAFAQTANIAVGDWPPYISQDLKHNGVVSHIIKDVFAAMGMDASIKFMPWTRAYKHTAAGSFTATGVWMHKTEREKDFIYSDAILNEQFVFFHNKSFDFNWSTIDDLYGMKMGGVMAYSYGPELDKALEKGLIEMARIKHPKQNFKMLLRNRIQLNPMEINVGYSSLKKNFTLKEQAQITHHPKAFLNNLSYVLFPKKIENSKELVKRFNNALAKIKASGQYEEYFKNFEAGLYNQ